MSEPTDTSAPVGPDAATLVGLLAEGDRLRVVAALVLGAGDLDAVVADSGLDVRRAATAVVRLVDGELVERGDDGALVLLEAAFRRAAAAARTADDPGIDVGGAADDAAKVLRTFFRDGRLRSIPTQQGKLAVVAAHLAQRFEPGVGYREREVDAVLREVHDDIATLRRSMVDLGLLDRRPVPPARPGGRTDVEYWRIGGEVRTRRLGCGSDDGCGDVRA